MPLCSIEGCQAPQLPPSWLGTRGSLSRSPDGACSQLEDFGTMLFELVIRRALDIDSVPDVVWSLQACPK